MGWFKKPQKEEAPKKGTELEVHSISVGLGPVRVELKQKPKPPPEKKSFWKRAYDASEMKPGVGGFRLDLKKLRDSKD